jgi:hypothetical protein
MRVDPADPKRNNPVTFWITFLNTTGNTQTYNTRVLIFAPDAKNSKGDTQVVNTIIPVGLSEEASAANWTIHGPGGCEPYIARIFWIDPNTKQPTEFVKPDQSGGTAVGFQMCP